MPDLDLTEKRFESDIEQSLLTYVGYQKGDPKAFDRALALDVGTLLAFVRDTQPKSWEKYETIYGTSCEKTFIERFCKEVRSLGLLAVLRHGFKDRGITFRVGAFTNLTRDYLDFHRTMEDYCGAKAQLFRQCEAAVCNGDDPWTPRLLRECACPVLRYGTGDSSRLRGENLRLTARSVAFDALLDGRRIPVTVPIPGRFTVYNALAALGICHMLGVPPEQGAAALQTASGIKGRMEVVPTPGLPCTVLIDYAHTPDALENVLTAVRGFAEGRVVAVFGCGGDRDREKRPQMGRIVSRLADVAVVTSDNPRWEQPEKIIEDILPGLTGPAESIVICDRREAIGWVLKNSRPRDVIVLCGKGHETYQEVCGEKRHMDERELVAAYTNG